CPKSPTHYFELLIRISKVRFFMLFNFQGPIALGIARRILKTLRVLFRFKQFPSHFEKPFSELCSSCQALRACQHAFSLVSGRARRVSRAF
ncbi:hypothetical protein, partial [Harryflintia acetispora]|uniref:hypothetical protein n=1 Tax=Harryflintia acetispora TaxID=1849041 RepID=UPI001A9BD97F